MGLIPPAHNYRFVEMGTSKELKNEALTNRGSFKNGRLNPEIADFFRDSDLYIYIYIISIFISCIHEDGTQHFRTHVISNRHS